MENFVFVILVIESCHWLNKNTDRAIAKILRRKVMRVRSELKRKFKPPDSVHKKLQNRDPL